MALIRDLDVLIFLSLSLSASRALSLSLFLSLHPSLCPVEFSVLLASLHPAPGILQKLQLIRRMRLASQSQVATVAADRKTITKLLGQLGLIRFEPAGTDGFSCGARNKLGRLRD